MVAIGGLLSSPIGIGITFLVAILLLAAVWKVGQFVIKLVFFLLVLAAITATVLFFKGGF